MTRGQGWAFSWTRAIHSHLPHPHRGAAPLLAWPMTWERRPVAGPPDPAGQQMPGQSQNCRPVWRANLPRVTPWRCPTAQSFGGRGPESSR